MNKTSPGDMKGLWRILAKMELDKFKNESLLSQLITTRAWKYSQLPKNHKTSGKSDLHVTWELINEKSCKGINSI